jgi:hypothetical protein
LHYPDETARLRPLTEFIGEVDAKLKEMEEERAVLLYLRNLALREAARMTSSMGTGDRRKVLRYLMREQRDNMDDLAASLGLQQRVVGDILEEIEKEFTETP